jgi:hypothetical protein
MKSKLWYIYRSHAPAHSLIHKYQNKFWTSKLVGVQDLSWTSSLKSRGFGLLSRFSGGDAPAWIPVWAQASSGRDAGASIRGSHASAWEPEKTLSGVDIGSLNRISWKLLWARFNMSTRHLWVWVAYPPLIINAINLRKNPTHVGLLSGT